MNYKMENVSSGIEGQFKGVAKDIRDNIPSIKLGGNLQPVNDPLVDKMKRWLLIGLTALVAGGAAILIIVKLIGKIL